MLPQEYTDSILTVTAVGPVGSSKNNQKATQDPNQTGTNLLVTGLI